MRGHLHAGSPPCCVTSMLSPPCGVTSMWGHLHVVSPPCWVTFMWGHLHVVSPPCWVTSMLGHLHVGSPPWGLTDGLSPLQSVNMESVRRLYLALVLYTLLKETNLWAVAERFTLSRGFIQSLLSSSSAFCACVLHFTEVGGRYAPGLAFLVWRLGVVMTMGGQRQRECFYVSTEREDMWSHCPMRVWGRGLEY